MSRINYIVAIAIFVFIVVFINSCKEKSKNQNKQLENDKIKKVYNPVVYFEIPVTDIDRAMKFYTVVFNFTFKREVIDKNEMALFPFTEENPGISGALAKGEIYKPTKDGIVIYFNTENIDRTLKLATQNGAQILYSKTSNGDLGFVAEFEDSEGNRIALHQPIKEQ
jgi:uncharacterized protein